MSKTTPPIIPAIPRDLVLDAFALGMVVETYAQSIAGHGITGRVAWNVSKPNGEYLPRVRYGVVKDAESAHARIRGALALLAAGEA